MKYTITAILITAFTFAGCITSPVPQNAVAQITITSQSPKVLEIIQRREAEHGKAHTYTLAVPGVAGEIRVYPDVTEVNMINGDIKSIFTKPRGK